MTRESGQSWVAWLRGLNLGGTRLITSEEFIQVFTAVGMEAVQPCIPSGYVAFHSLPVESGVLQAKLEAALSKCFASETAIALRTREELVALAARNPFAAYAVPIDAKPYVTFLTEPPRFHPALPLSSPNKDLTVLAMNGLELFSLGFPDRNGRVGFPNTLVERECGAWATTRHWKTLLACLGE